MEIWQTQARQCLAVDGTACSRKGEAKEIQPPKTTFSKEEADPDLKPRDLSHGGEKLPKVKTNVQTRSMTARASRKSSKKDDVGFEPKDILDDGDKAEKSRTNVQTRSMTARASRTSPESVESPPEFFEHGKAKRHLSAVNAEIMKHILNESRSKPNRRLTKQDLLPGEIYAFTRPSSPGYVKIGLTKRTIKKRLKDFMRNCKYSPHQETPENGRVVPYVAQIERLILAELSLHRRKESVCNGGAGCHVIHHEWVQVDIDLALEVIERWCSWAEKRPYDEEGVLRPEWEAHTKVPVRPASKNEREQGNRWQEWIDSFPASSLLSSANDTASVSIKSEEQGIAPNKRNLEKVAKHPKLRRSPSDTQASIRP